MDEPEYKLLEENTDQVQTECLENKEETDPSLLHISINDLQPVHEVRPRTTIKQKKRV